VLARVTHQTQRRPRSRTEKMGNKNVQCMNCRQLTNGRIDFVVNTAHVPEPLMASNIPKLQGHSCILIPVQEQYMHSHALATRSRPIQVFDAKVNTNCEFVVRVKRSLCEGDVTDEKCALIPDHCVPPNKACLTNSIISNHQYFIKVVLLSPLRHRHEANSFNRGYMLCSVARSSRWHYFVFRISSCFG